MPEIKKPINEIVEAIIDYVDPDMQRKVFMAEGFGIINGTSKKTFCNATHDDPNTLKMPEYRIFYVRTPADEKQNIPEETINIAILFKNYKYKNSIFLNPSGMSEDDDELTRVYEKLEKVAEGL